MIVAPPTRNKYWSATEFTSLLAFAGVFAAGPSSPTRIEGVPLVFFGFERYDPFVYTMLFPKRQ